MKFQVSQCLQPEKIGKNWKFQVSHIVKPEKIGKNRKFPIPQVLQPEKIEKNRKKSEKTGKKLECRNPDGIGRWAVRHWAAFEHVTS